MFLVRNILILLLPFIIISCTEKTYFSGKILQDDIYFDKIDNKKTLISVYGYPNYIDSIEKKYFYFSEESTATNLLNKKVKNRIMIVFKFDKDDKLISKNRYDLSNANDLKLVKETTKNNLIKRGFIQKVFGGVTSNKMPNTSN